MKILNNTNFLSVSDLVMLLKHITDVFPDMSTDEICKIDKDIRYVIERRCIIDTQKDE